VWLERVGWFRWRGNPRGGKGRGKKSQKKGGGPRTCTALKDKIPTSKTRKGKKNKGMKAKGGWGNPSTRG